MKQNSLKDKIFTFAKDIVGFDDCRFTEPFADEYLKDYRDGIDQKQHGDMAYLENHLKFKEHPEKLLPDVRSAVIVIKNYKNTPDRYLTQPYKIARYAAGKDYHIVIKEGLEKMAGFIQREDPGARCYYGVDSRPLADRTLALKAGLGFRGKNTMVIQPGLGSYFFIGVLLTTVRLASDAPLSWDCGQCRLCLDACPTGALDKPYHLHATRCISYMTIEQKSLMTSEQLQQSQRWIFGCDICQEVCPYNSERIPLTDWKDFLPAQGIGFDSFKEFDDEPAIPKDTALYRSRKRVIPNWQTLRGRCP